MTTTSQRRQRILQLLMEHGSVQVSELSPSFNVSTVTIRNDLGFFEEQGLVTRTYGGAYLKSAEAHEPDLPRHPALDAGIAARLGALAAERVRSGDTILIDAGPAMRQLAKAIRRMHKLTVMTNGLDIISELAGADGIQVICTGGMLNRASLSFHGAQAEQGLDGYRFDKVFLSADGFGIREGITSGNESEARMKRRMIESAAACIVVADSSVFGRTGLHRIAQVDEIDTIITDQNLPTKYRDALLRMDVELVVAG
jgi:DeoR family transcriptional regulator, aga operon transcriptional repressor